MRIAVRFAVSLFLFSGAAYAQDNPYVPSGGGYVAPDPFVTSAQRQQFIQNMLLQGDSGDNGEAAQPPQESPIPKFNEEFQELRSQQADDADAVTRERVDREQEIQELKDAFAARIDQLQKKIDEQQTKIDNLRYQSRF
jgi:hypothetical protein